MFVLNREKNGNRPCSVCICLARGSRWLGVAGSGPQQRVSHDVDDGSERLTSPRRVTIDASASGEPPILTLDAALSPRCGIASHLGLTQLHRRCLGLAFGASASVWVSPCGTVSFPSRGGELINFVSSQYSSRMAYRRKFNLRGWLVVLIDVGHTQLA